jgi:uncharacterized protein
VSPLPECDTEKLFREGLSLFNTAQFFEAHEVLEDVWRAAPEPDRKFLQGLIQIAVGLHHHSTGNVVGCQSLLKRGLGNLARYPDLYFGLALASFRAEVEQWRSALEAQLPLPAAPVIRFEPD